VWQEGGLRPREGGGRGLEVGWLFQAWGGVDRGKGGSGSGKILSGHPEHLHAWHGLPPSLPLRPDAGWRDPRERSSDRVQCFSCSAKGTCLDLRLNRVNDSL